MAATALFSAYSCTQQSAENILKEGEQYYGLEDYGKAVECFRKAAEQGLAEAQANLGMCYDNGNGVEQDFTQAFTW